MTPRSKLEHARIGGFSIDDLTALVAVAESGSFRQAAAQIGISQSAVSRRVRKVEDSLGVSIFERSPGGARLTTAGWGFASDSRCMVKQFLEAVRRAQCAGTARNGQLRVGLIASLSRGALRDLVLKYVQCHANVDITFVDADRSELKTLLSHRLIDVLVAAGEPSSGFGEMLFTKEQLYIAVAKSHPLADRRHVGWQDVEAMTFVVGTEEPGPEIHDYILRRASDLGRQVRICEHRLEREGILNLVGLGFGITLLCDHWLGVRYPNVVYIPIQENGKGETIPFSLSWRPENDNPALRRFLSLAREAAKFAATPSAPL